MDPDSILLGLWGGNFSVRREHWLRVNQRDRVGVGFMHTDREFGLQLRQLGMRGRFDRRLRATHHDERDVTRLADAARGTALAHARLHEAYPDLIPSPDGGVRNRYAHRLVMALVVATRRPQLWRMTLVVLAKLIEVAHSRSLAFGEYWLARLVWRLAYEREVARAR
jgi:hypothetical protein